MTTTYTSRLFFSCQTFYEVLLNTFNPPTSVVGRTAGTSLQVNNLQAATQYTWRVRSRNCCGPTLSDTPQFTTAGNCYPDCDQDGALTIDDFICFQTLFALNDKYADCDQDGILSIDDFICFQTLFAIGC